MTVIQRTDGRPAGTPAVSTPAPRDVWGAVLDTDPGAVVSQSLPWADALFAGGRYRDVSRLYEFGSGNQVVLPLSASRVLPAMTSPVASWPRVWNVGGPLCRDGRVTAAEAAAVLDDVARMRALTTQIWIGHGADRAWIDAARADERRFRVEQSGTWILDLGQGDGHVWERKFRSSVRRAIRKAERSDLDIEVGHAGQLIDDFYGLYVKSVQRWARMQHAPLWLTRRRLAATTNPGRLARVARSFGPQCSTWVARSDGQPVAALIVLRSGRYAKAWHGAMDKDLSAPLGGVSQLLDWLAIQSAVADGYSRYDLGYATPGTSLGGYKERLGADLALNHLIWTERIPVRAADQAVRGAVKKAIGFRDNL
jgi:CelD/BcsL family acetyltransferase involved in cellulose biosynthesis